MCCSWLLPCHHRGHCIWRQWRHAWQAICIQDRHGTTRDNASAFRCQVNSTLCETKNQKTYYKILHFVMILERMIFLNLPRVKTQPMQKSSNGNDLIILVSCFSTPRVILLLAEMFNFSALFQSLIRYIKIVEKHPGSLPILFLYFFSFLSSKLLSILLCNFQKFPMGY